MPVGNELKAAFEEWEPQLHAKLNRALDEILEITNRIAALECRIAQLIDRIEWRLGLPCSRRGKT
jgi:hypothetical protein